MNRTVKFTEHTRIAVLIVVLVLIFSMLPGCSSVPTYDPLDGVETVTITDDYERAVRIPADISRIAASGSTAQMILMTVAPEMLVGLTSSPSTLQMPYFPEEMWYLPTFGQFYGSKSSLNMEALIDAQPQLIIDLGDRKISGKSDMDVIQKQTGIPVVFFEATLETLPATYRTLGKLLGCEEQAEKLAAYVEKTTDMAAKNSAKIPENSKYSVMFGTGSTGLACNAQGSSQADVIEIIGAKNAIIPEEITDRGGGTIVSLEEVYTVQPDVILLSRGGPYNDLKDNEWSGLNAVKNDMYYEIPDLPYSWMASPPSVNRVLGVWWLGNLLYPEYYDYDMTAVAIEFYDLFWHYDLSDEEAAEMLANSTGKKN